MPPLARSHFTRSLSASCLAAVLGQPSLAAESSCDASPSDAGEDPLDPPGLGVPGRPLRIAGAPCLAATRERSDWQADTRVWLDDLDDDRRAALALAWARDAQLEHASVAAFARHALELLALGAPPALLVAVQHAMHDEIEHARRCFGLASAYAGRAIGPAELPIAALGRSLVEPLAVARELFEAGCLNETFAALEAARAAELAEDPVVAELLAVIADDEARHAALAWRTLTWLAERYGAVATWLRDRASRLDDSLELALPATMAEPDLARHGRLGARERLVVQRQAVSTIIRPTLRVLTSRGADVARLPAEPPASTIGACMLAP